jgi:hypothetical protein
MAIPTNTVTNHHFGNTVEDITTSINAEDFPFLADMLNGLYSDPKAAVLREYATNAWDSHVEAGVTRPIEITLPTPFSPQLVIRDFGMGLSVDDLRAVYSKYGRSSKRDTNAVAGQLGMGCKSGLSYAPSFTIAAIKGGVRVVAVFTKNENGLGVIKVLDTAGTSEPNGVTITIPVETNDIAAFGTKATKFFSFWEPGTVLINGKAPEVPEWHDGALWLDTERQTCCVRPNTLDRSYVIMGNVAYPVPDAVKYDANGYQSDSRRFVARLNISDVDFAPSREEVKYTKHTDATLSELSKYIFASYDRAFNKAIESVTSAWEETMMRVSWATYNGRNAKRHLVLRATQDRPIWSYDPNPHYGRRAARALTNYDLSHVVANSDLMIVTGFPASKVSGDARARIRTFAPASEYLILLTGTTGVGMLDGRPNVVSYDDVLAATAPAKRDKGARGPKVETRYTVRTANGSKEMTIAELMALATDPAVSILIQHPRPNHSYSMLLTDPKTYLIAPYSTAQEPRIRRHLPMVKDAVAEFTDRRQKVAAAITEDDKVRAYVRSNFTGHLANLDTNEVADPEVAAIIKIRNQDESPTAAAARNWNVAIPAPKTAPKTNFSQRYPLLSQMYGGAPSAEILLYVNAKYAALNPAASKDEAAA